jgi:hypothetical protein
MLHIARAPGCSSPGGSARLRKTLDEWTSGPREATALAVWPLQLLTLRRECRANGGGCANYLSSEYKNQVSSRGQAVSSGLC